MQTRCVILKSDSASAILEKSYYYSNKVTSLKIAVRVHVYIPLVMIASPEILVSNNYFVALQKCAKHFFCAKHDAVIESYG